LHREGALALALGAGVGLYFTLSMLKEGAQHVSALQAVKLDLLQLRKHTCAARHHSSRVHHLVQVLLPASPHLPISSLVGRNLIRLNLFRTGQSDSRT